MGQYYLIVNVDKGEYLNPHKLKKLKKLKDTYTILAMSGC